ncbi:MAG: hypothetical protein LBH60_01155 [Prevotellaceae bacterium]|jgi:hypothetical protein|nr:hypothetical protein [Prevotellaceae bacterium]
MTSRIFYETDWQNWKQNMAIDMNALRAKIGNKHGSIDINALRAKLETQNGY